MVNGYKNLFRLLIQYTSWPFVCWYIRGKKGRLNKNKNKNKEIFSINNRYHLLWSPSSSTLNINTDQTTPNQTISHYIRTEPDYADKFNHLKNQSENKSEVKQLSSWGGVHPWWHWSQNSNGGWVHWLKTRMVENWRLQLQQRGTRSLIWLGCNCSFFFGGGGEHAGDCSHR